MRSDALENQGAIGATKAEIVFDSHVDGGIARGVGTKVQITFRVLVKNVDGRWNFLMMQGQHREDGLNAARAAQ